MSVRIICINKSSGYHDNPYEAIAYYGWINESTKESGRSDRQTMVNWLNEENQAYVADILGNRVFCVVKRSARGLEFLQTESDGKPTDNLLNLPECK